MRSKWRRIAHHVFHSFSRTLHPHRRRPLRTLCVAIIFIHYLQRYSCHALLRLNLKYASFISLPSRPLDISNGCSTLNTTACSIPIHDEINKNVKAPAVYHETADGQVLRRTYQQVADRARGLAYYLRKRQYRRVGILAPNTPAFLEAIYGIAAAGGINVGEFELSRTIV